MKLLTREGDPSFILSLSWDFKLIIRKVRQLTDQDDTIFGQCYDISSRNRVLVNAMRSLTHPF